MPQIEQMARLIHHPTFMLINLKLIYSNISIPHLQKPASERYSFSNLTIVGSLGPNPRDSH